MTQPTPYYDDKDCYCTHDRHRSNTAVWFDSTGFLKCLQCDGWQRIKHVVSCCPTNGTPAPPQDGA